MDNQQIETLKYPIGKFKKPEVITPNLITNWIDELAALPAILSSSLEGLTDSQLDTPYRPGGWTLRQVVHHIPDSHMNAYIRFKLAVTEDSPIIRPYFEDRWAECQEAKNGDIKISVDLLKALHHRWVAFLRSLTTADFKKNYVHPEHNNSFELGEVVGMYVWHGNHHLNHILQTKKIYNW